MKIKQTVILIGPPGSGKGYYSHWLTTTHNFQRLASGDVLRKYSNETSTLGEQISICLKDGILVSDELMTEIFFREIRTLANSVVLDGYPRTLGQEKMYHRFRKQQKWTDKTIVISLVCSKKISEERVTNRAICNVCGASYHPKFSPSQRPGECDFDKTQLLIRNDAIKNSERWDEFEIKTAPLIELFKNNSNHYVFQEINTEKTISITKQLLIKALGFK